MSVTKCVFCERLYDEDFNVEHENECRIEKVWDELITKLIELKGKNLINDDEYKTMKEDMELLVVGTME